MTKKSNKVCAFKQLDYEFEISNRLNIYILAEIISCRNRERVNTKLPKILTFHEIFHKHKQEDIFLERYLPGK